MRKVASVIFVFLSACSTHTDIEYRDTLILKQESVAYSKIINFWVDGRYIGTGKHKKWVPGYWDKKIANPYEDPEFMWKSGQWKEVKNEK